MNRSRMLILGLSAILLVALLAACSGDDEPNTPAATNQSTTATTTETEASETSSSGQATEPENEPTATEAEDAPTEASETEATATEDDGESATAAVADDDPTATSAESEVQLVGTASVEDDSDDVVSILMQEPDDPMPGIDLTSAKLEADGSQIVVTIQTAGDIATELSDDVDVSFDVHIWQDDQPAYALSLQHNGSDDWEATVTDFSAGLGGDEETVDTEISVSGNVLTAAFPVALLPEIESPFDWYTSVMLSEGGMIGGSSWFDGAPENVIALLADPEKFVEFPQ